MSEIKKLDVQKEEVYILSCFDLEDFIKEVYGRDFSVCFDTHCRSGEIAEFVIDDNLDKDDLKEINDFIIDGTYSLITECLMKDLCKKGSIPAGTYFVYVYTSQE
jgi:hypothetical protein